MPLLQPPFPVCRNEQYRKNGDIAFDDEGCFGKIGGEVVHNDIELLRIQKARRLFYRFVEAGYHGGEGQDNSHWHAYCGSGLLVFCQYPNGCRHFLWTKARCSCLAEELIAESFFDWAGSVYGSIRATPQSVMGRALAYALGERKYLENVFLDGRLELSNNRAERSIRPFAIGLKNWLFSNTPHGASASAMFYSIIETAKENGLKPFEYLKYVLETAPNLDIARNPDAVARLLP